MFYIVDKETHKTKFFLYTSREVIIIKDFDNVDLSFDIKSSNIKVRDSKKQDRYIYTLRLDLYKFQFVISEELFSIRVFKGKRLYKAMNKLRIADYQYLIGEDERGYDQFDDIHEYLILIFTFLLNHSREGNWSYMSVRDKELHPK